MLITLDAFSGIIWWRVKWWKCSVFSRESITFIFRIKEYGKQATKFISASKLDLLFEYENRSNTCILVPAN
jgi:hypothetical protein